MRLSEPTGTHRASRRLPKTRVCGCGAIVAAVAATSLLAACGGDAPGEASPPEVTVVTLAPETVTLKRELPGRVSPYLVAEIRPQASGIVRERIFEEGGQVKAGEILYRLEDSAYRADAESARAELARAEATLVAGRATERRIAELVDTGAVSRQERDTAVAALGEAEAGVGAGRAGLARARVILAYTRIASPIAGRIGKSSVTQGA